MGGADLAVVVWGVVDWLVVEPAVVALPVVELIVVGWAWFVIAILWDHQTRRIGYGC